MTSLAKRIGLPLAVVASVTLLAGCDETKSGTPLAASTSASASADETSGTSTSRSATPSSTPGGSTGAHSAMFLNMCKRMLPIFKQAGASGVVEPKDMAEKVIKDMPEVTWTGMSPAQRADAEAGIRAAAEGSCD